MNDIINNDSGYRIKPACFNKLLSLVEEWKSNGARLTWEQLIQGVDRLLEIERVTPDEELD